MKLRRIVLDDYRGVDHADIMLGNGVTIIEGPNEAGKSSIAEALTLVRRFKATSNHGQIRAIRPVGRDAGPQVTLELSTGPYELTLRKRWAVSPITELDVTKPHREQLTGDDAHDRFLQILEETVDASLLEALDVQQGKSLDQPLLADLSALQGALGLAAEGASAASAGAAAGAANGVDDASRVDLVVDLDDGSGSDAGTGFDGHEDLMARIEAEYARYFTPKGRPNKAVVTVIGAVESCQQQVEELQERSRLMNALVEQHAQQQRILTRLTTQQSSALAAAAELEAQSAGLRQLKEAVDAAQRALADARSAHDLAARDRQAREEAVAEIVRRTADLQSQRERLVQLTARLAETEQSVTEVEQQTAAAQSRLDAAREESRTAERALNTARDREEHDTLAARLSRAEQADAERGTQRALLQNHTVTEKTMRRLRTLSTDLRVATELRNAAAAQVTVRRLGDETIRLDEQSLEADSATLRVREPLQISVNGIIEVEVLPGESPARLEQAVEKADQTLRDELKSAGVGSADEAQVSADRRVAAETALRRAEVALSVALDMPDDTEIAGKEAGQSDGAEGSGAEGAKAESSDTEGAADALSAALDALRQRVAVLNARIDEASDEPAADRAGLEKRALEAAEAEQQADREVRTARTETERVRSVRDQRRDEHVRVEESLQSAIVEHDLLADRLETARSKVSDRALERAESEAQTDAQRAQQAHLLAVRALAEANADQIERELENATAVVADRARDLDLARERLSTLQGEINAYAAEGIYDRLQQAEAELTAAVDDRDRVLRAARAAQTLRDAFLAHRDVAQQQYVAPFRDKIHELGRLVFGRTFEVAVSPDLTIASRTLAGRTVPFESLSGGAREQLALIGRLACAQLVAGEGGAPLVLDDALGFSDPDRLHALNLVLAQVGHDAQVIVLTCQPDRFAMIGGAQVVHLLAA